MAQRKGTRNNSRSRGGRGSRSKGGGRNRGLGILFWLLLLVIIVAVGFAARDALRTTMARLLGLPAPAPAASAPTPAPAPTVTISPLTDGDQPGDAPAAPIKSDHPATAAPSAPKAASAKPAGAAPRQDKAAQPAVAERPSSRKARLYFAAVDADGGLLLRSVIRSIPATDSPLRDTLASLLKGPTAQELNQGLISLIPTESGLRGVVMKGDTAVLDFNEGFRFNGQGMEAMNAQLRQVVYAATEFPNVKRVQIQIEGKTVRYLGTEGVRIDAPLDRSSFAD
jgi:germination protein M